jgi:cytochrome c
MNLYRKVIEGGLYMKLLKMAILMLIALSLAFSVAVAEKSGSVDRGKAIFEEPTAFGGNKACSECHPNGSGLEKAASKNRFSMFDKTQGSLEEVVNYCIIKASKGESVPQDSQEMKDVVAYIKSLGEAEAPGYGTSGYGSPGYGSPGYGGAPGYK